MKTRLLKKVFAAVLSVAMIFNINVIPAAAESVKVQSVYTNVRKLTMATDTNKQITTYTVPENATNQKMSFSSSDSKVAKVTQSGVITAVAPGDAVITVTARDGSKANEKIQVKVLENLVIDKATLDNDGEVVILEETYGNMTIKNSVGEADIYLSGVSVANKLMLEKGDYNVFMFEAKTGSIEVVESTSEIVSFSTNTNTGIPGLHVLDNSNVSSITSDLGLNLTQDDSSEVKTLTFNFSGEEDIKLSLEGFTGNLVINMSGTGNINLGAINSNIQNVTVVGAANSGTVELNNTSDSKLNKVNVGGSASVNLNVPTDTLNVGTDAKGSMISVGAAVASLNNKGANTNLTLGAEVGTLNSSGSGVTVQKMKGGEVKENASKTPVTDVNATGTVVMVPGINAPSVGGSVITYNVGDVILHSTFDDGKILLAKRNTPVFILANVGKDSNKSLLTVGRTQAWYTPAFSLASYAPSKAGKHITVRVTADVMYDSGDLSSQQIKCSVDGTWTQVAAATVNKGTWGTITGTYEVTDANSLIFFETANGGTNTLDNFYIDNVKIEIASVRDIVRASGVSVAPATKTVGIGQQVQLTATVTPANAENTAVTWLSDSPLVAWVSPSGNVTAVGGGTANIYATTVDGGFKAVSVITVDPSIRIYDVKLDKDNTTFTTIGDTIQLNAITTLNTAPHAMPVTWISSDASKATVSSTGLVTAIANGTATITAQIDGEGVAKSDTFKVTVNDGWVKIANFEDKPIGSGADGYIGWTAPEVSVIQEGEALENRVLKVVPKNWNTGIVFNVNLPEGTTLADYSAIRVRASWRAGDVTYKQFVAEAGTTLTGGLDNKNNTKIAGVSNGAGSASNDWTTYEIPITAGGTLSGAIKLAIGISCNTTGGTTYYLDDIFLVKKPPANILLTSDFENGADPFTAAWNTTTAQGVHNWGIKQVKTGTGIGYNGSNNCYEINAEGANYKGVGYYFAEAGTYTITAQVKRAEAGTAKVRFLTGSYSALKEVEINGDSWTEVTHTFTLTAPTSVIIAPQDGATPAYHYYIDNIVVSK